MTKKIFLILAIITSISIGQTAREIIDKAENSIKGETAHGKIKMTVVTEDYTRTIEMESWWQGNEKALIKIYAPKREAGNKTLKIGNEMWNYLKNTETTMKIPPSMMLQSWNGSDFSNDDLVRESNYSDDYIQKIVGVEMFDGENCWIIELTPKPDAPVVWGKLVYKVRQDGYLPAAIDYIDEEGVSVRTLYFTDVKKMHDRMMPTIWKMVNNLEEGRYTEFRVESMEFDIKLKKRMFSFRELERGN